MMMAALAASSQLVPTPVFAQAAATGSVTGRVFDAASGRYLAKAKVSIEGTSISTYTNEFGDYTLTDVPAGSAVLVTEYVGQPALKTPLTLAAGQSATRDITFNADQGTGADDGTITLNEFVVSQNRFRSAQEIAINDEKNSTNIKDVMAADALGYIPNGNIGEFVKFLPGVETLYGGNVDAFENSGFANTNEANASLVSVRGFGAVETAITIDGVPLSSVGPGGLTRAVTLDMASINNAARVELIKVPTPDMPGNVLGGTINLVTKSAFEYAKPSYSGSIGFNFITGDGELFKKEPGPANKPTYHTRPNGSISVAVPVNKNFGFTVSTSANFSYSPNYHVTPRYQHTGAATYATANSTTTVVAFPNTTSPTVYNPAWVTTATQTQATRFFNVGNFANGRIADVTNPYLRQAIDQQNAWSEDRYSGAIKLDWRPFPGLDTSLGYTHSIYTGINVDRRITFTMAPMFWTPEYQLGRPFIAASGAQAQVNPQSMEQEVTSLDKEGVTQTGYFRANYRKGPWEITGSVGLSKTDMDRVDFDNGHVHKIALGGQALGRMNFFGIKDGIPTTIETFDRSGNPIDYRQIRLWNPSESFIQTAATTQVDKADNYKLDVRRQLDFLPFRASVKVGGQRDVKKQNRDGFGTSGYRYKYTGPLTPEYVDSITDFNYRRSEGIGFATNQNWADPYKAYELFRSRPELFSDTPTVTMSGTHLVTGAVSTNATVTDMQWVMNNYFNTITTTRNVEETTDAWYGMIDASFLNDRLNLTVGARQSRSEMEGTRLEVNNRPHMLRNPNGTEYRDSVYTRGVQINTTQVTPGGGTLPNGFLSDAALLGRLQAAGVEFPDHLLLSPVGGTGSWGATATGNMELAKRQRSHKPFDQSRKNPVQPSVIASYKITDDLVFKPSWTREISLPPLDGGNNGTQGIVGIYTIAQKDPTDVTYNDVGGNGTITIANSSLRPKKTDSFNGQLAYYYQYGNISANYYYKFIQNAWEELKVDPGHPDYAATLDELGLSLSEFQNYTVTTTVNAPGKAHANGYELSFRQNFGYLGNFMSYFNAFGNYSRKNSKQSPTTRPGATIVRFPQRAQETIAGGLNFSAYRFSLTGKATYKPSEFTRTGTFVYQGRTIDYGSFSPDVFILDLDATYQISKNVTFYISAKNVTNNERKTYHRDAEGLIPKHAQMRDYWEFGTSIATGLQFQF
jgi:iron complex outermembrane receptor protein